MSIKQLCGYYTPEAIFRSRKQVTVVIHLFSRLKGKGLAWLDGSRTQMRELFRGSYKGPAVKCKKCRNG